MQPSYTEDFNQILADLETPDVDVSEAMALIEALERRLDLTIARLDNLDAYLTHPSRGL